jgi:uncharacterized protein YgiM (DUF1202 family)
MKTKWTLTVLSFISLVIAACSNDTANQNSTTPPTTQPQVQPPVVVSPTPPQVTQPQIQPPVTSTSSPGQTTQPVPVTEAKTAEILVNDLNVRSSPDTNSQVRGTLPKGTQAKIIQQQGNWYYIVMGRVEGWVSGSYIKVLDGNPGNVKR